MAGTGREGVDGFEVGLDSGSASGVGASDGVDYGGGLEGFGHHVVVGDALVDSAGGNGECQRRWKR